MITPDRNWSIHNNQDPKLARFIRDQTSLNIDPAWYSVNPGDLERLCAHPYVYAKDLLPIRRRDDLDNIKEYLLRGGFLFIDPCLAILSKASRDRFGQRHGALFTRLLPDCIVRELPDGHDLFHCYFDVTVDDLFSPDMIRAGATKPPHIGMLGVFLDGRMVAVISTSGLECGWPQTPGRTPGCMKMIVNGYVYAMTRGVEPTGSSIP